MINREEIHAAQERLSPHLRPSPTIRSNHLSERFEMDVYLKLENLQDTGSFKVRGALNRLLCLSEEVRARGVVAASAGNHAQGVAWAASRLGVTSTIFMPRFASIAKLLAARAYGGTVIQKGESYDEASGGADQWVREQEGTLIPAFDDPFIIAGQGTIGLEILDEVPEVDSVIVPVGGGGLIAGIALAIKTVRPETEILGVQAAQAPAVARSVKAGTQTNIPSGSTIADGIAVATPGKLPLELIRRHVDRVLTVDESLIETAMITLLERKHLVVEGAGAVPLALLMAGDVRPRGPRVVLVISGGNLDLQLMDRIIQRGTFSLGRRMRLRVVAADRPGSLHTITGVIAEHGANILQVYHERLAPEQPVNVSRVDFDLEIQGCDQVDKILRDLEAAGIQVLH